MGGKCLSISCINLPPTFVLTDLLYGGLNHITFLCLFRFGVADAF